jgi:phosphate-selective porin OprO and OprP
MVQRRNNTATNLLLTLIGFLSLTITATAQQKNEQVPVPGTPDAKQHDPTRSGVAGDIDQLRSEVEQLRIIVEQQQQALLELTNRLTESEARSQAATLAGSSASTPSQSGAMQPRIVAASLEIQPQTSTQSATSAAKQGQAKEQNKPALVAGWDDNHAFLKSSDGSFLTYLTGYAQLDFRGYQSGNHPANTFLVRRARLALEGKVARYYDFKVEGDFADTSSTLLRDFYVRVHRKESFQVAAGQFKEPFSQEELRSDAVQDFVERSLANNLAPSRSPGIMVSGVLRKGIFEYQLGAFNGKGLLASNSTGTPEGVVRLRFAPWKNTKEFWTRGLSFGGAYALGRNSLNGTSVRGQTESRSFTFFSPDTVNGPTTRANGELTWLVGPAAVRVEYDQANQARNRLGSRGIDLPGVVAKAYTGQFTYLLTGENKSELGTVAAKRNLFGDEKGTPGFGAWELKLRYSNLQINDGTAKSNHTGTFYFGANWYLNRFVRYLLDFGVEQYKDPLRTPRPGDNNFFVILSRVQVAF